MERLNQNKREKPIKPRFRFPLLEFCSSLSYNLMPVNFDADPSIFSSRNRVVSDYEIQSK